MPADPAYHTVAELQAWLRLSKPDPILGAIKAGDLKAVNVGGGTIRPTWRISQAALDDWLESRTAKPTTPAPRRKRQRSAANVTPYF